MRGCLSVVSVVCCNVEVSVTCRSLVQRSPTECSCVIGVMEEPNRGRPDPSGLSSDLEGEGAK